MYGVVVDGDVDLPAVVCDKLKAVLGGRQLNPALKLCDVRVWCKGKHE